jgi:hypothetical protein
MSLLPSNRRTVAAVATLVASDILLAVMAWQVALVVRNAFGHYPSSEITIASVVPNMVAWIGLRAVLGLYPGYGLDQVEEVRRQTFELWSSRLRQSLTIRLAAAFSYLRGVWSSYWQLLRHDLCSKESVDERRFVVARPPSAGSGPPKNAYAKLRTLLSS